MTKTHDLGDGILLITDASVSPSRISTAFVVAHGDQLEATFSLPKYMSLYFPWGMGHFGWYDKGVGFRLYDHYREEREGGAAGLTAPSSFGGTTSAAPAGGSRDQLLLHPSVVVKDINLVADDLNADLSAKMLGEYYKDTAKVTYPEDVAVVCLKAKERRRLSEVINKTKTQMGRGADLLYICLCCSVVAGEKAHHKALVQAAGYQEFTDKT